MLKNITYSTLIVLCSLVIGYSQASVAPFVGDQIGKMIHELHDEGLFNGTVLVAKEGKVLYKAALGYADFESKRKLLTNTPFYLGSVSKQFTTMCIMMLKEKGLLSYEDKLSKYFPKFPAYADSISIRQMMQHTSGIPDHYRLGIYKKGLSNHDVLLKLINQSKLNFTPGNQYSYSNGAYVLLAMIVEKVSRLPFAGFAKSHIFGPLKMNNSWVASKFDAVKSDRAIGHTPFGAKDDYEIFTTGAGGIYSTVEDLLLWDRALTANRLIKKSTLEEAFAPAILNDASRHSYGFGWGLPETEDGRKIVSHGGSLNGFRTQLARDLTNGTLIVILTNTTNLVTGQISKCIDQILQEQTFTVPAKEDQMKNYVSDDEVIIDVLYAVISGDAGQKRDWDVFRYLFKDGAKLIPTRRSEDGSSSLTFMTSDDYVNNAGERLEKNGFFEKEVSATSERFGSLKHVFSTYESFHSSKDTKPFARGINSIQMHFDGHRWWIVNIYWNAESKDEAIPTQYLESIN